MRVFFIAGIEIFMANLFWKNILQNQNIRDIIFTIDFDLNITFINDAVEKILGFRVEDIKQNGLEGLFCEDSLEEVTSVFQDLILNIGSDNDDLSNPITLELQQKCQNGEKIWVEMKVSYLYDSEKYIEGILAVCSNIENLMEMRKENQRLQNQLILTQKIEAVGILAGGIAHDFNNLLTEIQGYIGIVMEEISANSSNYSDLSEAQSAVLRAAELTKQLLLFSRKQAVTLRQLNINTSLHNILKMLKRLIGEDINISTDFDSCLWNVQADAGHIDQVIMNLAVNARDAMQQGGTLSIRTENVLLNRDNSRFIDKESYQRFVCISIQDTGSGIKEDTLKHIFEPFFTTKEANKGTGLGLAVVYGIIAQYQGHIEVDSKIGVGTTFHLYLPATKHNTSQRRKSDLAKLQNIQGNGEVILIVEDDPGVRKFVEKVLSKNGYVVHAAKNAKEAMILFEKVSDLSLAIIDVVLPDKTGLQLIEEFMSIKSDIGLLFMSGYTDEKSQWKIIKEQGYNYIQKPYTMAKLLEVIREILC